jgi:sRNA-binding protein
MTVQCCVCKKERVDGAWRPACEVEHRQVSHTYCPTCLANARAEMQVQLAEDTHLMAPASAG